MFPLTTLTPVLVKLEARIASLEKTCVALATKIEDQDVAMCRRLKASADKLTLDIKTLTQEHKSTKVYVQQTACTAMEALKELGNEVHQTLENMLEVLDNVPNELADALRDVAGGTAGDDADSALEGIRQMQSRWADLANLVEKLIPKTAEVVEVARASRPPTPQDPIVPSEVAPSEVEPSEGAPSAVPLPHADEVAPAALTSHIAALPNDQMGDIAMVDVEPIAEKEKPAFEGVDNQPSANQREAEVEMPMDGNEQVPAGGVDGLSELTAEDAPASPPADSPAKRKLDDDADDAPIEKKKKKVPAPKKKGGRRKGRSKVAEAEDDLDAEGEEEA